jgi:hypothetical protein
MLKVTNFAVVQNVEVISDRFTIVGYPTNGIDTAIINCIIIIIIIIIITVISLFLLGSQHRLHHLKKMHYKLCASVAIVSVLSFISQKVVPVFNETPCDEYI